MLIYLLFVFFLEFDVNSLKSDNKKSKNNSPTLSNETLPSISRNLLPIGKNRYIQIRSLTNGNIIIFALNSLTNRKKKNSRLFLLKYNETKLTELKPVSKDHQYSFDDIFYRGSSFIAIDTTKNIIFIFDNITNQFTEVSISVSPDNVVFHPIYQNLFLIESQNMLYVYNHENKFLMKVSPNVKTYFWRNEQTTKVLFIERDNVKRKLFVMNPFVEIVPRQLIPDLNISLMKHFDGYVFILTKKDNKTNIHIMDSYDNVRTAHFPNMMIISDFRIERMLNSNIIISIKTQNSIGVSIFVGNLENLKFVRIIDDIFISNENKWKCTDIQFHSTLDHILFVNQIVNKKEIIAYKRTLISYDLGVRWSEITTDSIIDENDGKPCDTIKCTLYLYMPCSRKRRKFRIVHVKTPHIMLSKGNLVLHETWDIVTGIFISTDYGYTFKLIQRGNHDPYMINDGSIIITTEINTRGFMYSYDEGITFKHLALYTNENTLAIISHTSPLDTKILLFTYKKHSVFLNIIDFDSVFKRNCTLTDYFLEYPEIEHKAKCYRGLKYKNYRKRHDVFCKIDDKPLPKINNLPCHCNNDDFGCSFGYYMRHNMCYKDPEHFVNTTSEYVHSLYCSIGSWITMTSPYQKVFEDECIGKIDQKTSSVAICKINAHSNNIIIKMGNTLKLFVSNTNYINNLYNIPIILDNEDHFHSFFFDFNEGCLYYVIPNVGLKQICYYNYLKLKSFVTKVSIHSTNMYQAAFDYIGSNFIILDARGLYLRSKYKKLEKTLIKNDGNTMVSSFKSYPTLGKIIAYCQRSGNIFVIKYDGSIINSFYFPDVHGFVININNEKLYFWNNKNIYYYDEKLKNYMINTSISQKKILVDVVHSSKGFVYIYKNEIDTSDGLFVINDVYEVFAGYKYDQFYNYCGDPPCDYICVPDGPLPKTKCICPDDSVIKNSKCQCLSEKPDCFKCRYDEFSCGDGVCISIIHVCDGINDCLNKRDEANCTYVCNQEHFRCSILNSCLSLSKRCNKKVDCPDGSDEAGCVYPKTCKHNEFTCDNTKCISKKKVCNEINDCGDNSDEYSCKGRKCSHKEFKCKSDNKCVPISAVCNDIFDCADLSDESNCHTVSVKKHHDCDFKCDTNKCLKAKQVCDHFTDCKDHSDEMFCNFRVTCLVGYNPCLYSNNCYNDTEKCNGIHDCADGTDETDCPSSTECKNPTSFVCLSTPNICIKNNLVCNGIDDCNDGSDEEGCKLLKILYITYEYDQDKKKHDFVRLTWYDDNTLTNASYTLTIVDSSFVVILNVSTSFKEYNIYDLKYCESYTAIVSYIGMESKHGSRKTIVFRMHKKFREEPSLESKNATYISWKMGLNDCTYTSYYITCIKNQHNRYKTFTNRLYVHLNMKLELCYIYSCYFPIYDIQCSKPLKVYIHKPSLKRKYTLILNLIVILSIIGLVLFVAYNFKSTIRRYIRQLVGRRYMRVQTFSYAHETFDEPLTSESDTFIN